MEVGLPGVSTSAKTQTLLSAMVCLSPLASDDLELLEEGDDALVGVALVLDLLAGLALLGLADLGDLLAGPAPADLPGVEPEVGDLDLVDRLVLGRHDPLEGRVARLDDAGRHAHHR